MLLHAFQLRGNFERDRLGLQVVNRRRIVSPPRDIRPDHAQETRTALLGGFCDPGIVRHERCHRQILFSRLLAIYPLRIDRIYREKPRPKQLRAIVTNVAENEPGD
jgi:hypothetical protein